MARFYGKVGYEEEQHEDPSNPGVWIPTQIHEHQHFGTILKHSRRWDASNTSANDDLTLNNRISIVADAYINEHWPAIKYVIIAGTPFKVLSVDIARPRYILNLGGVWNGHTSTTP